MACRPSKISLPGGLVLIGRPFNHSCRKPSATASIPELKAALPRPSTCSPNLVIANISTTQQLAPAPIEGDVENIVAPATNPFNPFGEDVFFRYRVTEAGPRIDDITTDAYRAVVGLEVELPGHWNLESAFLYSETDSEDTTNNNLSRPAVIAALADPDPATSFNIFGAGNDINNPATIRITPRDDDAQWRESAFRRGRRYSKDRSSSFRPASSRRRSASSIATNNSKTTLIPSPPAAA